MPNRDGTGPFGKGSGTGKGRGPCGCGMKRGGRRFSDTENAKLTKDEQKKILEAEIKEIDAEKQQIEKRLKELKE